ncbi:MAG: hypothetical protein Kow0031_37950 [Anaerolineae bacterium]
MNEQQLADIFSEQLDLLLNEQPVTLPAEAAELQELLGFGQQFAGVQFQPSAAAQAAFQGQLATWFPTGAGISGAAAASVLGIPKNLVVILLVSGSGLGLAALLGLAGLMWGDIEPPITEPQPPAQLAPTINAPAETAPAAPPADENSNPKSQRGGDQLPGQGRDNSAGDTINAPKPASTGDTLPVQQPVVSSTETLTPTTSPVITPGMVTNPPSGGGDSGDSGDSANSSDPATGGGDDDRGHGNDPGGFDPDNPGNSTGVGGGQDNAPNLGRGNDGGSSGGNSNNGNAGGNSDNNKGKGKGKDK